MQETCIQKKFSDPLVTAKGQERAFINLDRLKTLWFCSGTLCNLECKNCYIESSPKNDQLSYISLNEVMEYLDEIKNNNLGTEEIGITGGEPFMNPEIIQIMEECLKRGFKLLVLTNAMKPMEHHFDNLLRLKKYHKLLTIRVSIDHFDKEKHEEERGINSFTPMLKGLKFLSDNDFDLHVAGRSSFGDKDKLSSGYQALFAKENIKISELVLFPEMDEKVEVPEITTKCWNILNKNPSDIMCASSRMVVKRKNNTKPTVIACTLLPYDTNFELGHTLRESSNKVYLNHKHCAKFCVLGNASCS